MPLRSLRLWWPCAVVAATWGFAGSAGGQTTAVNPCLSPPPAPAPAAQCPNLVLLRPSELHRDTTTHPGHVLLRATSSLVNVGAGPLEIRGTRVGPRTMLAEQVIYDSSGNRQLFDTGATLDFKFVPGFRYDYGNVGRATYWKFRHAAAFQLWSIDSQFRALQLVRTGPKLDYCLRDLVRMHRWARSPQRLVYPACRQNPRLQHDRLGTSTGWADVYPYGYPQQWIDVTGLRGRFAFVQIADPQNHIWESDEQDNVSEIYISLPSARVIAYRTRAASP